MKKIIVFDFIDFHGETEIELNKTKMKESLSIIGWNSINFENSSEQNKIQNTLENTANFVNKIPWESSESSISSKYLNTPTPQKFSKNSWICNGALISVYSSKL